MNLRAISTFTLSEKYSDIREIVENNYPLNEITIPKVISRCEQYAKENNLMFLYPMGISPIYFIFREKTKTGRKRERT